MWGWRSSRTFVIGTAGAIFVGCCILPIAYLILTSLLGVSAAAAGLILDARQRTLFYNTTLMGIGTAVCATAIGAPLGIVLARVPLKRKTAIRAVLAAPILLPPYVTALAWIYIGSGTGLFPVTWTYSLPASVVVLSLVFYPLSMLASEVVLREIDGRLEEAALVVASPQRVIQRINLPLAAPVVAVAALVIFVLAISEFGVPGLLGVRVYTTEVFTAFAALYDFSRAIVLAVPSLMLCAVVGAIAAWLLGGRIVTVRRLTGAHPPLFEDWEQGARLAIAIVIAVAFALPVSVLARTALNVRTTDLIMAGSGEAIANSVILSAIAATTVSAVGICLGYARARARDRVANLTDTLFVVLFAIPSTIVGIGLIGLWNRPGVFGTVYGTDTMFILAYLARFIPVSALMLAAAIRYVPSSHEEAAAAAGADWFLTMRRIVLPQLWLGLAAAWVVVFVLSFGELGASVLIAPPGESTLPIRIYTLVANTPPAHVAALALLQSIVIFTPLVVLGTVASLRRAP